MDNSPSDRDRLLLVRCAREHQGEALRGHGDLLQEFVSIARDAGLFDLTNVASSMGSNVDSTVV